MTISKQSEKESEASMENDSYEIRSASNVLKAMDMFITHNALIGVSELKKALHINSNMAFRILHTLEKARYIVVNPKTGKYHLSIKALALGKVVTASLAISKIALPSMQLLANDLKKVNVVLLIHEGSDLIIAERIDSRRLPVVFAPPGRLLPIHATAAGKFIMSEMPTDEVKALSEKGFEKFTEKTITSLDELEKEFESIRENHIAWEREEHTPSLNGIAAPVRTNAGEILACVSINGFSSNVSLEELDDMQYPLLETARTISESMSYVSDSDIRV